MRIKLIVDRTSCPIRSWIELQAPNGKVLMSSEGYSKPSNARCAAKNLIDELGLPMVEYEVTNDND